MAYDSVYIITQDTVWEYSISLTCFLTSWSGIGYGNFQFQNDRLGKIDKLFDVRRSFLCIYDE